jgi:hypothetical protein
VHVHEHVHVHLFKCAHARMCSIKHKLCPRLEKTINYGRWILLAFATLSTPGVDCVIRGTAKVIVIRGQLWGCNDTLSAARGLAALWAYWVVTDGML